MTETEIRRLNRQQLLEMLTESEKNNEALKKELEEQQKKTAELEEKLASKSMELGEAGDIVESAERVNKVFEDARAEANAMLSYIRELEQSTADNCRDREDQARQQSENMLSETMHSCENAKAVSESEADKYWTELTERLEEFYASHKHMRDILSFYNMELPGFEAKKEDKQD